MFKLLDAGFTRLRKSKAFLAVIIFTVVLALFMVYSQYSEMKTYNKVEELDRSLMNNITVTGIVIATFTSLFVGREYSDGTLRNKIIVGCSRTKIYLSNLILVISTSILAEIIHLAVVAAVGIPLLGGLVMSAKSFALVLLCYTGIILAFSAIFTFIAMVISNKTIISIVSILLAFGLMMIAMTLFSKLEAPEYQQVGFLNESGEMEFKEEKNPKYLTPEQREVYQNIVNAIPSGQAFMVAGGYEIDFRILPLYSLADVIIFTGIGLYVFNKKELN